VEQAKRLLLVLLSLAITLMLVEVILRAQQRWGPIADLELNNVSNIPSEILNHTHAAREDWHLADASKYGPMTGFRYTSYYDERGVRIDPLCSRDDAPQPSLSILFLGDSFMEGYDLENTVPRHVCRALNDEPGRRRPVRVLNAAMSSYSPSIFIVQAKLLVPVLRPDLVVVDIDETDLGDDYLRYRALVVRDDVARIVAVRSTAANRDFTEGFLRIKEARYPLYVVRLAMRTLHTRLRPQTHRARAEIAALDPLVYSRDTSADAEQRYSVEIGLFEGRVDELIVTLSELLGDRSKILLTYHPHLQHLQPDADGHVWNRFVSAAIARAAAKRGVSFYDATEDLRRELGARPQDYYWANDMHFNFAGLAVYGRLLAARLAVPER